jgi:hypothetical protein
MNLLSVLLMNLGCYLIHDGCRRLRAPTRQEWAARRWYGLP